MMKHRAIVSLLFTSGNGVASDIGSRDIGNDIFSAFECVHTLRHIPLIEVST